MTSHHVTCHVTVSHATSLSKRKIKLLVFKCNDLKLELRLHLGKGLRKYKGRFEVVKCKDTGMYLRYIY